tara:strand:- start:218 stop:1477 length:1260 start_codon:yes stop_codon:yes gene_type:complete
MKYELKLGDNAETLKEYPDNYFDSIVTDPPYGIEFLGKDWDKNTGVMETWHECYRVLKPGGHILAFSAARTYHNLATNIELAGFEIRDQLMWLYGSGFPKAQDIGKAIDKRAGKKDPNYGTNKFNLTFGENPGQRLCKICNKDSKAVYSCDQEDCGQKYNYQSEEAQQWSGWKTALKPAHEPIVMARKPFKGSCLDNVLKHSTGALNIDESRVPYADEKEKQKKLDLNKYAGKKYGDEGVFQQKTSQGQSSELGRYPSNVIGEIPEYQNYFYSPKVSRKERHIGFEQEKNLDHIPVVKRDDSRKAKTKKTFGEATQTGGLGRMVDWKEKHANKSLGNNHPTVKPVELMKYLIKLVTPKGGKVLDPFNGSGSTGMACVELDYEYTGCELDPEYIDIATKRIEGWYEHTRPETQYDDLFDE